MAVNTVLMETLEQQTSRLIGFGLTVTLTPLSVKPLYSEPMQCKELLFYIEIRGFMQSCSSNSIL